VRLSLISLSLSHTCISVSTCLLLISSFIAFLFICLHLACCCMVQIGNLRSNVT
jgi:hypothetical protein